jgi:hypothetical protein
MPTPSILIVPNRYKSGVLYSQLPETGAVDFDVTRATPAFRTNASGVSESVASGVPRLDYPAAGGCPSLLVEPAATNFILRSEEFDNASWGKVASATVSGNTEVAPNGTSTADTINLADVASSRVEQGIGLALNTTYTFSIYFKNINLTSGQTFSVRISSFNPAPNTLIANATVDLFNGTVFYSQEGNAGTGIVGTGSASIVPLLNGWFRVSLTVTRGSGGTEFGGFQILRTAGSRSFYAWGAQLETGSVATSYIPTTSAAVTRNADVISKTGVSGFIGQSVGTLYAEVDVRNFQADGRILAISNGTSDNRIMLQKGANATLQAIVTTASGTVADIATASGTTAGVYKVALGYAADDFVLYVNGSQIGTDTSGAVPACTDVYLGKIETSGTTNQLNDRIRAAAIYTTRLSNTELAALTSL